MSVQTNIQAVAAKVGSDDTAQRMLQRELTSNMTRKFSELQRQVREAQRDLAELDNRLTNEGIGANIYSSTTIPMKAQQIGQLVAELLAMRSMVESIADFIETP